VSVIAMPKLSDSMEEGTILSWLKRDGDAVELGEDLVEIETGKATVTYQAEGSGVLTVVAADGATLAVGAPIGWLGDDAPAVATATARAAAPVPGPRDAATHAENGSTTIKATPLARRAAQVHGVVLAGLEGSGPLGRVTRADVLRAAGITDEGPSTLAVATPSRLADDVIPAVAQEPVADGAKGRVEVTEPSRVQTVIARRMAQATATIPHFQVSVEVDMGPAIALRGQFRQTGADPVPSYNDLIVKSAALALRVHPRANGSFVDGQFRQYSRVNVGIAVAAADALLVPTIFDADVKSVGAIAADARRLAACVRDGSVAPADLSGATFTVSNLGMYGVTAITPVINAPQAAILGVGATREILARVDGEIVDRQVLTLTLSCDHRILYGADAAAFLVTIQELLEQPLRLAF
jgi:pyruvate dehydrogenase E2 component (dihydrolipoamide acetyltransferase)